MHRDEIDRLNQLEAYVPDVWTKGPILYVGANQNRFYFSMALKASQQQVFLLEIETDRANWLRTAYDEFVIGCGDIRTWDLSEWHPNTIIWSHGPSVLPSYYQLDATLSTMREIPLVVLMCPWGKYDHGDGSIREVDRNKLQLYPDFFVERGFAVHCIGEKDVSGSNLLAWRRSHGIEGH